MEDEAGMGLKLVVNVSRGADTHLSMEVRQVPITVGASPMCDIVLSDPCVSRNHARVTLSRGKLLYTDDSTNGSFFRGRRITEQVLDNGDVVTVPPFELRFDYSIDEVSDRTTAVRPLEELMPPDAKPTPPEPAQAEQGDQPTPGPPPLPHPPQLPAAPPASTAKSDGAAILDIEGSPDSKGRSAGDTLEEPPALAANPPARHEQPAPPGAPSSRARRDPQIGKRIPTRKLATADTGSDRPPPPPEAAPVPPTRAVDIAGTSITPGGPELDSVPDEGTGSTVLVPLDALRQEPDAWLVVEEGPRELLRQAYPLPAKPMTIGRGDNADFRFEIGNVSRVHAKLTPTGPDEWTVEDLCSLNGTFLGEKRITEATLRTEESFRLATSITFRITREPAPAGVGSRRPEVAGLQETPAAGRSAPSASSKKAPDASLARRPSLDTAPIREMVVTTERAGDADSILVVQVHGRLDAHNYSELGEVLETAIDSGERNIMVDLSDLEFIDHTGLGVLVRTTDRLDTLQGQIRLVSFPQRLQEAFTLNRLDTVFGHRISNDIAEAIAEMTGDPDQSAGPDR